MKFSGTLAPKVVAGAKTVTRRPVVPGAACPVTVGRRVDLLNGDTRRVLGRLQVESAHTERIDAVTTREAILEGFHDRSAFMAYWLELYGLTIGFRRDVWVFDPKAYNPNALVWRIKFRRVA